ASDAPGSYRTCLCVRETGRSPEKYRSNSAGGKAARRRFCVAEGMRRTNPRRAGARASLCHHLPEGSSAVIACKWRGKDWFTTIRGLRVRACCVWLLNRVKNLSVLRNLGRQKNRVTATDQMSGTVLSLVPSNQRRGTN